MTTTGQGPWAFYRAYTQTATHTAATAALAIFGLLVFVDPVFAVLAIASYLCPPVVLYLAHYRRVEQSGGTGWSEPVDSRDEPIDDVDSAGSSIGETTERDSVSTAVDTDRTDGDTDAGDTGSDPTDADSDIGDTDSDPTVGDTDLTELYDGDTDTDPTDGDTNVTELSDGDTDTDS